MIRRVLREQLPPITLRDLVAYTGASGELNPVHYDPEVARAKGLDGVLVHGTFLAGLAGAALVRRWGRTAVEELEVRFVAPVWCGDAPELEVRRVAAGTVELEMTVRARVVLRGRARLREEVG